MTAEPMGTDSRAAGRSPEALRQVRLSQAAGLARNGNYPAAEGMLAGLLAADATDAAALDLLARIRAQQGALPDAASLWGRVQQMDPRHPGAGAGLARLRAVQRRPLWLAPALGLAVGFVLLGCGAILLHAQTRRQAAAHAGLQRDLTALAHAEALANRQQARSLLARIEGIADGQRGIGTALRELEERAQVDGGQFDLARQTFSRDLAAVKTEVRHQWDAMREQSLAQAEQLGAKVGEVAGQVAAWQAMAGREQALTAEIAELRTAVEKSRAEYGALDARHDALARMIATAAKPPKIVIHVPGVTASPVGDELLVVFHDGLFARGSSFKPGAKERLDAVAKALGRSSEPLRIQAVGYADDERALFMRSPQWESSLALARASAVVEHLIALGLFQTQYLAAVAGDSRQRPVDNNANQDRAQNRTLVLRVAVDRRSG